MLEKKSIDLLLIGEVAKRSGVAISALHFYEAKGLIPSRRNEQNQRVYKRSVLRLISLIKTAQSLGFSLEEVTEALRSLPSERPANSEDWKRLARSWREELENRIDKLTRLRDNLTDCIGCGCLTMNVCPLRNPNDTLARKGPGPHLL